MSLEDRGSKTAAWLQLLYELCQEGKLRKAIREVFEKFMQLAEESNAIKFNEVFEYLEPGVFPVEVDLAFLSITSRLQNILPNRAKFRERLASLLERNEGPEKAQQLLAGL